MADGNETDRALGSFAVLGETGAFAVNPERAFYRNYHGLNTAQQLSVNSAINDVLTTFDIRRFYEIPNILSDPLKKQSAILNSSEALCRMYGIKVTGEEAIFYVSRFAETADKTIDLVTGLVFKGSPSEGDAEMINEVRLANNAVDVLALTANPLGNYSNQAQFEAKRKWVLMRAAASVEQRKRETNSYNADKELFDFLGTTWDQGKHIPIKLESIHDPDTFECVAVERLDQVDRDFQQRPGYHRVTTLVHRTFTINGHTVPIYTTIRPKLDEEMVLKMIRKSDPNPARAIEDEVGLIAVLETKEGRKLFHNHLLRSARILGEYIGIEQPAQTSLGGKYSIDDEEMGTIIRDEYFVKFGGKRAEVQEYDRINYLRYLLRDTRAHDEYRLRRLAASGSLEDLFPFEIYGINHNEEVERARSNMRREKRARSRLVLPTSEEIQTYSQ